MSTAPPAHRDAGPATLDVERVRRDFPALQQKINGKPLVYLDNAATAQKPRCVIDTIRRYYESDNANIHRGVHQLSVRATDAYERARGWSYRHENRSTQRFSRGTASKGRWRRGGRSAFGPSDGAYWYAGGDATAGREVLASVDSAD